MNYRRADFDVGSFSVQLEFEIELAEFEHGGVVDRVVLRHLPIEDADMLHRVIDTEVQPLHKI